MELEIKELLRKNIKYLYIKIPIEVFEGLLITFIIGSAILFILYGWKRGLKKVVGLLLAEYLVFIYCSTVILRKVKESASCNFRPFWSYEAILNGKDILIAENILNVVVFLPVGILLRCAFRSMTCWKVLLIGMCVSGAIEAMQFVCKRGFAEIDDVINNTIGCLIGYGLFSFARYGYEKASERNVAVL